MKLILSVLCLVVFTKTMSIRPGSVGCMLPRPAYHNCTDEPSRDPPPSRISKRQDSMENHMGWDDDQDEGDQQNQLNYQDVGELEYDHQWIDQGQTYPKQQQDQWSVPSHPDWTDQEITDIIDVIHLNVLDNGHQQNQQQSGQDSWSDGWSPEQQDLQQSGSDSQPDWHQNHPNWSEADLDKLYAWMLVNVPGTEQASWPKK